MTHTNARYPEPTELERLVAAARGAIDAIAEAGADFVGVDDALATGSEYAAERRDDFYEAHPGPSGAMPGCACGGGGAAWSRAHSGRGSAPRTPLGAAPGNYS